MKAKKTLAVLIAIALIAGWVLSVVGFGEGGNLADRMKLGLDMIGGVSVVLEADTDAEGAELKSVMDQVEAVMEKRVNEMGLSEPLISVENENRIRIELPGAQNAREAIESIGRTAKLSFRTADGNAFLEGEHVKNAVEAPYQGYETRLMGTYTVNLEFDSAGQSLFEEATRKVVNGEIHGKGQLDENQIAIFLDDELISAPYVQEVISSASCQITGGNFTSESAGNLAALIRGGSLPVALSEVETDIVGPTMGLNAAKVSVTAGVIGIVLILIIMLAAYKVMGLVADAALLLYVLLELWILILFKAVLTLPGIAGMILSVGMAVDSNVIIFSRIREEISIGKTVRVAVRSGYKRAMSTIIDSQVTTVIAALILYEFGSGQVRGFALTLLIGIIISLFTAVVISNLLLSVLAESKQATPKAFGVKPSGDHTEELPDPKFSFLGHRKIFYAISAGVLVIGLAAGALRGFNLGIDFTGGTMIQLNVGKEVSQSEVSRILSEKKIENAVVQHAGEHNEKLMIKTTMVLSNDDRSALSDAIYEELGVETEESAFVEEAGLIGPTVGAQLKKNAIKSMLLAALAMLIYVAVRFEWRYGIAAVLALTHDCLLLFAVYGILHIQMNSPFISGLLIVIGYSINDTIVIFDRIRENGRLVKKPKLEKLIDISIEQTVARSVMTSLTTLFAIIPLIIMGGTTIRAFTAPLIIGVLGGTASSICIAPALYYEICRMSKKNKYKGA